MFEILGRNLHFNAKYWIKDSFKISYNVERLHVNA